MSSTSLWNRFQKYSPHFAAFLLCAIILTGCDSPKSTVETLRLEIREYERTPSDTLQVQIEQNFAKLEKQVADLKAKNSDDATDYQIQLSALRSDYQSAQVNKALIDAKNAVQGIGNALKDGAKAIEKAFRSDQTNSNN